MPRKLHDVSSPSGSQSVIRFHCNTSSEAQKDENAENDKSTTIQLLDGWDGQKEGK